MWRGGNRTLVSAGAVAGLKPSRSIVRLTHHDLASESHYEDMNSGWSWAMDSFKAYLETGHPISHQTWLAEQDR